MSSYIDKIQIHKTNRIASVYPSTKFLVVVLYMICSFVVGSVKLTKYRLPLLVIPWFLVVLLMFAISGYMKKCMKAMKAVVIVATIILAVQTFIVPGGELVWQMGFLKIYEQGLRTGINLSFLIMNIAGIFVWFFQTTENKEISYALEASGMNHKMAYTFISTLQMIEILGKNSKTIMNAQRARGVETEGNVIVRAKAFFPSLVPLILGAVISSEERVLTLEARGFSMQTPKTHLFRVEKSGLENTVKFISIAVTVLLIVGRVVLWII